MSSYLIATSRRGPVFRSDIYSEWSGTWDVVYAVRTQEHAHTSGFLLTFSLPDPPSHCGPAQHAPPRVEQAGQLIQGAGEWPAAGWAVRAWWGEGG